MPSSARPWARTPGSCCRTASARLSGSRTDAVVVPRSREGTTRSSSPTASTGWPSRSSCPRSQVAVVPVVTYLDVLAVGGGLLAPRARARARRPPFHPAARRSPHRGTWARARPQARSNRETLPAHRRVRTRPALRALGRRTRNARPPRAPPTPRPKPHAAARLLLHLVHAVLVEPGEDRPSAAGALLQRRHRRDATARALGQGGGDHGLSRQLEVDSCTRRAARAPDPGGRCRALPVSGSSTRARLPSPAAPDRNRPA